MSERHSIIAFIGTLVALVTVYAIGALLAYMGRPLEALGLSGVGTGLIGVLGTFRPRHPTANVEQADTVNQGAQE